ncbi:zinc ribbon domain-containing protein [Natronobacterium gregoryi]|uniref:3-hydroxy-3-methylglutaryl-CoA synthase n=2 Tax=Natronobacterium gregoryi TaxID=44930 RepID=L0AEY3_NATGS|nr:zinc ribbon domain-containing protein [Natronobacterium gregoryi]AFZ72478.1 3-hydroxy-3-methylglutaryl CoA synthase [Natronobacterium gregoryi SP2]ELY74348.1 3-hydroxy-3-methylglutaryl-CoA synthase [Natronobacterium gregoryi SP2]PLK21449.1 ACP synthase [Natronobacterium gregoryi SP2]SFI77549.1 hydroxymethylglutaryl-CoA synthase [Natronobacterium gregoryi]
MTLGIDAVAAYAPRYRITAATVENAWGQFHGVGISETAVPAADEDTLTMAGEAATMVLTDSDLASADVSRLFVATTTPPLEEGAIGARLASFLGLAETVETRTFSATTRAGVDALATTLEGGSPALVVASDAPRGAPDDEREHAGGAGAAALVVTDDGPGSVVDRAERTTTFPGTRFRPAGSGETTDLGITAYDRSAFTETVAAVADDLEYDLATADAVALQSPNGKLPYRAAGPLGVETDALQAGTTVHDLGDTGAASALLGFASALEAGHTDVVLIGYGPGGGTAIALAGTDVSVATDLEGAETLSYGEYLRMRGDVTPGEPAGGGAYVSVPSWKRTLPQRHRLVAGRCRECGVLAFPPEGACTDCGAFEADETVSLPGTGTVEAATVIGQGGAPPEFVEQQAREGAYVSAIVALDGPAGDDTVSTPAQVRTVGEESVSPGDRVEATIRRIYTQEDVIRYGFKMQLLE